MSIAEDSRQVVIEVEQMEELTKRVKQMEGDKKVKQMEGDKKVEQMEGGDKKVKQMEGGNKKVEPCLWRISHDNWRSLE